MADGIGPRWRAAPWGLFGALAMIVGFERTLSRRMASLTPSAASGYDFAAKAATHEGARSEILGFGDSLVKFGFQPRIIEARTGRTAYNLAAYAAPPARDYQMLKRVLDAGGRPTAIVVCFQAVHLGYAPTWLAREFAEFVTPTEALDLAWSAREMGLFGWLMLARNVPSIRARFQLRENLTAALRGKVIDRMDTYSLLRRNWNQARGAQLQHNEPHAAEDALLARTRAVELYPEDFHDPSARQPFGKREMHRFLDLAAGQNIPVFWVMFPMLPALEARQHEIGLTGVTDALAREMHEAYPNVIVVDGRARGYDASAFVYDAIHLNRRGATTLSRDLGDIICRRLANPSNGSSWVSLPAYRPTDDMPGMEDLAQSRAALRWHPEARR